MIKKERMYERIKQHGKNLMVIFGLHEYRSYLPGSNCYVCGNPSKDHTDPVILCKRLFRLEKKAHYATTCLCNTNTLDRIELTRGEESTGHYPKQATEEEQDAFFGKILDKVDKLLNFREKNIPVFINHDPRGYALKIKDDWMRDNYNKLPEYTDLQTDWGGYGIIAPEIDGRE